MILLYSLKMKDRLARELAAKLRYAKIDMFTSCYRYVLDSMYTEDLAVFLNLSSLFFLLHGVSSNV